MNTLNSENDIDVDGANSTAVKSQSSTDDEASSPLHWTVGPNVPCSLYKGTCAAHSDKSYCSPSGSCQVYIFDHLTLKWSALPKCPQSSFALVMVEQLLTAVGGFQQGTRNKPVNSLQSFMSLNPTSEGTTTQPTDYSLSHDHKHLWMEHFPPMPTKRYCPSAVFHKHVLVVAGGSTTWVPDFLTTVEILDVHSLQWSVASSLPRPINASTAAACVNDSGEDSSLFFLGGWDKTGNAVFTCSLQRLLSTCVIRSADDTFLLPHLSLCSCAWHTAVSAPYLESSCVCVENRLFAVGGKGWRGKPTGEVHMFNPVTSTWILVGHLMTARSHSLVTWSGKEMVVVGGLIRGGHVVNCMEVATVDKEQLEKFERDCLLQKTGQDHNSSGSNHDEMLSVSSSSLNH